MAVVVVAVAVVMIDWKGAELFALCGEDILDFRFSLLCTLEV